MPGAMARRFLVPLTLLLACLGVAACGTESQDKKAPGQTVDLGTDASVNRGATLFVERCSGCHNIDAVGAEGGAQKVKDRERTDGPNFNVRKEDKASVLYAIRNGGFSGANMPQNIVVGSDAEDVANYLSKYAGGGDNESDTAAGAAG